MPTAARSTVTAACFVFSVQDVQPTFEQAAARIVRPFGGSGVYVAPATVLTNWHVCFRSDDLTFYNDPEDGSVPYVERTRPPASCSPVGRRSCSPQLALRFGVAPIEQRAVGKVVFAAKQLDLCILRVQGDDPIGLGPLGLGATQVQVGQEVVAASYPHNAVEPVFERCRVTAGTTTVADPDRAQPTDLRVPSFAVDCATPQHGSSGGAVYDAESGALLGLIWTLACKEGEVTCRGPVYVSAVHAWRALLTQRPSVQTSRLRLLFDKATPAPSAP